MIAEQGLVTIMDQNGKVLMKVVTGRNGDKAQEVADRLKADWPMSAGEAYEIASRAWFGGRADLVVIDEREIFKRNRYVTPSLYRETFDLPRFNPRCTEGKTDHLVVVTV